MAHRKENRLLTLYANYNKLVESIKSSFDVTAGYDYQYWKSTTPLYSEMNTLEKYRKHRKPLTNAMYYSLIMAV